MLPFFEPALLKEIEEKGSIVQFRTGDVVVRKGQYFKSVVILLKGLIKVYREDDEGNEFFIYYLEPLQGCALSMVCASRRETSEIMVLIGFSLDRYLADCCLDPAGRLPAHVRDRYTRRSGQDIQSSCSRCSARLQAPGYMDYFGKSYRIKLPGTGFTRLALYTSNHMTPAIAVKTHTVNWRVVIGAN